MFGMKDYIFITFGILSIAVAVVALCLSLRYHKTHSRTKRVFSALHLFIIGIYIAVLLQYIPIYYFTYDFGDSIKVLRPLLLSVYQSLEVFLLNSDYALIKAALDGCNIIVRTVYSLYSVFYFVLAPVLTASFILSLFNDFTSKLRFRFSGKRPIYILSKLNTKSLALAKTIRKYTVKNREKAVIVFTDVSNDIGDAGSELLYEAEEPEIRAIFFKCDITHLNLSFKKGRVELFLIDEDESANIECAVKLTEAYKTRPDTKIYVYAASAGSAHIIDSLDKGDMLFSESFKNSIISSKPIKEQLLFNGFENISDSDIGSITDGGFMVSRIDSVRSLVLDTFVNSGIFKLCEQEQCKTISLLIVGMGEYGRQILKTALWYCQLDGYKLEINVVDSGQDRQGVKHDIEQLLAHECPEIISLNPNIYDGDSYFDIRFFNNIDCFSGSFDELFTSPESKQRLKRTKMAFVSLGDDDKNIEAAITLRKLFDRLNGVTNADNKHKVSSELNDLPIIYSIVFDDKKTENLNINNKDKDNMYLINYKGTPYHIKFIGNLSSQYSYKSIMDERSLERDAFIYHTNWVKLEKNIRDEIYKPQNQSILNKLRAEQGLKNGETLTWDDDGLYNDKGEIIEEEMLKKVLTQLESYMKFEYFRSSSISKAVHKRSLFDQLGDELSCKTPENGLLCSCAGCERRRKTEHMRWNAYMRVNGYIYGDARSDRGLVHPDLKAWDELDTKSKYKD